MVDLIAVVALVVSVFTAAFVMIKQGIGLAIEYRESPETSRRKVTIEEKLQDQYGQELTEFLNYCSSRKSLDIKDVNMRNRVIELGQRTRYLNLGTILLEQMTRFSKRFLRAILISIPFMSATIVFGVSTWETDPLLGVLFIVPYGAATAGFIFLAGSFLQKYYFAREKFVALSEDPSLDNCQVIVEEMRKKGII